MTIEVTFGHIHLLQDESDPTTWSYWADRLEPERSPDGRPTVTVTVMGAGALLQLGARWAASERDLAGAKARLAELDPQIDPALVRLAAAPATVSAAVLELGDGRGAFRTLATAPTSGFAPYQVIFSASLDPDGKAAAAHALAGRTGWLRVRFPVALPRPASVEGRLTGDMAMLSSLVDAESARSVVKSALEDGTFRLEVTASNGGDSLMEDVRAELLDQAARLVSSAATPSPDAARIEVVVRAGAVQEEPVELTGDVGEWFASEAGDRHITDLATSP